MVREGEVRRRLKRDRLLRNVLGAALALSAILPAIPGCRHGGKSPAEAASDDSDATAVTVEMATATRHPMDTSVSAQGTLTAGQGESARVAPVLAGRLSAVLVREGDHVTAGQVVAMLENRPQQAAARSANAAVNTAETQAREAETAYRATATDQANTVKLARLALNAATIDRDNAVQQARTALATAQTTLAKTRAGSRPQEIAQADENVRQDQATRDRAAIELTRMQDLFNQGIAARRQLEDAQTALAVADATLAGAKQQASLVRAGPRPEDLRAAELAVQQAHESLDQAQMSGDAKVAQAQAALRQAEQGALQVQVKQQDALAMRQIANQKLADYNAAQATAGYAQLRAPLSGIVTHRSQNPGDQADPATPILEITDTHGLNLIANLPAEDGLKVRPGMAAHITTEDMPDKVSPGHVLSVGQVDPQTNLLAVRIAVANPQGRLKVGAFATADIILHTDPNAVVVPKQALVNHESGTVVFVVGSDNVAHQREVTTGPEQGDLVQIIKGVTAGEKVVKLGQYELSDGAKVQAAPQAEAAGGDNS